MRPSQLLAALAFLSVVPASVYLAFVGHDAGLYPYGAVPIAFGVIFALAVVVLFALLPAVKEYLG